MKLVMGSCRVTEPLRLLPDVILYPGGGVHASAEFVQGARIMRGELTPPEELKDYMFHGWGVSDQKTVDLSKMDTVVIELCSLKRYVYQDLLLHPGYEDRLSVDGYPPLKGVELHRETKEEVLENLNHFKFLMGEARIVVVLHNNIPKLPSRSLLADVAAQWCRVNDARLVDPTAVIEQLGVDACLLRKGDEVDYNHYTDQMKSTVIELFTGQPAPDLDFNFPTTPTVTPIRSRVEGLKRFVVRILRFLHLKRPAPERELGTEYD